MPTAARLAGALAFALLAWYLAGLSLPFFPNTSAPDYWIPASVGIGLIVGWSVCGKRVGRGYNPAISLGVTSAGVMAFGMLFLVSLNEILENSMRLRYAGPIEAVIDIFAQMIELGSYFLDLELVLTLLIGGVICAWLAEFFGRRYP